MLLNQTLTRPFEFITSGPVFSTGLNPAGAAVGDFNSDGKPDLAIANTGGNSVTVLLGKANGSFAQAPGSPFSLGAAGGPVSVVVGDFNGDGKPDIATANSHSQNVTVLLGNGTGGFTASGAPVPLNIGPGVSMVTGGFQRGRQPGPRHHDPGNSLTLLLGNGTGGFTAGDPVGQLGVPSSFVTGDFDRNGKPDLVSAFRGTNGSMQVALGDGTGSFTGRVAYHASLQAPNSMAAGDFNKDGLLDVAVADSIGNTLTVLLGNGAGGLSPAAGSPFPGGKGAASMAAVDVNQDGNLDLVTADYDNGTATVLLGNGLGGFTAAPAGPFTVGPSPRSLVVGDFNGDGRPDLAFTNDSLNKVTVLLNSTQLLQSIAVSPAPASVAAG